MKHPILRFLTKYDKENEHPLFDPYKFRANTPGVFDESTAIFAIEKDLIDWSFFNKDYPDLCKKTGDRLNAKRFLKRFDTDEKWRKEAIEEFIAKAREIHICAEFNARVLMHTF